jgi:hypothetical protein
MRREIARRQHPKGHVFLQLLRQLAREKHSGGETLEQHLDHHRRVKRLIARTNAGVAGVKCVQADLADVGRQIS